MFDSWSAARPRGCCAACSCWFAPATEAQPVWTLAGTDQDTRGVLTMDSPETAEVLAYALAQFARDSGEPMNLMLGPLSTVDPAAHALASALPGGRLVADTPIPVLDAGATTTNAYLSQGMRRTLRKAFNRLANDGHTMTVTFTKDVGEISDRLPVLAECHRDRDHVHGRQSDLDNATGRRVWESRLMGLALRGRLELALLTIDDEFAAHTLEHTTRRSSASSRVASSRHGRATHRGACSKPWCWIASCAAGRWSIG